MYTYTTVNEVMQGGASVRRKSWPDCKKIRLANDGDKDTFMHMDSLDGLIVEDCEKKCDCKVGVWIPDEGDKEANDWEIINGQ